MAALILKTHFQTIMKQNICALNNAIQVCNYSQEPKIIKNPTTTNLKRGTGGRCSFNGIVCTVFGNTGFYGHYLCNKLGKIGTQMILPYRGDFYDSLPLKLYGDLGQILFHPFDLRDEESILKCIKYSNVVINLIGREWETKNFTYNAVNVDGAARLARICKQNGIERFIHLSCLNASSHPEPILLKNGSRFLKSKWEGECAVRQEFPEATIIRPSATYGVRDRFIPLYCRKWRMHLKGVPLYKKGETIVKQPICASDVAAGIVAAILNPSSAGKTYQFVGPHQYKLADIVDWFHELLMRDPTRLRYRRIDINWSPLYKLKVSMNEFLSLAHPIDYLHWEGLEKESISDKVIEGIPTLEDLGITPIPIDTQMVWELQTYVYDASYQASFREFSNTYPPKPINNIKI